MAADLKLLCKKAGEAIKKAETAEVAIDALRDLALIIEQSGSMDKCDICAYIAEQLGPSTGKGDRWFRKYLGPEYKRASKSVGGAKSQSGKMEECPDCHAKTPNPKDLGEIVCSGCGETFYITEIETEEESEPEEKKKEKVAAGVRKEGDGKSAATSAEGIDICARDICGHKRSEHDDEGYCCEKKCCCSEFLSAEEKVSNTITQDNRPLLEQLLYGRCLPEDDPHYPVQQALRGYKHDAEHYDKIASDLQRTKEKENLSEALESARKQIKELEDELVTRLTRDESEKIDLLKREIEEYKAEVADLKDQLAKAQFTTADKILDFWIFVPRKKVGEIAATIDKMNWDKKQSGFSIRTDGKFAVQFKVGEPV